MDRSGSSPHTRGALRIGKEEGRVGGIIPAYAGSTSRSGTSAEGPSDHPRIRGEHVGVGGGGVGGEGSSPHTRGARSLFFLLIFSLLDHPRIRGEHWSRREVFSRAKGSSPHTRGARPHVVKA